jgi:glucosamine--fructose-6-phosphate aminotransferase (isomerizing)
LWSYYFKELAWIPTNLNISSEFLCDSFLPDKKTLYVFLSQSWETADVRESLKIVKSKWCMTFWIVNSVWSTIAKMSDFGLYCHSWVEVWVASTKNVIAQNVILLIMALSLGLKRNLQHSVARGIIDELWTLKDKLNMILLNSPKIKLISKKYSNYQSMFFLWRNLLYPVASEWSLKCKELSYVHIEAYSTWELKHWPLALVWPDFPCVVFNTRSSFYHKTVSNIKEIKARHGNVLWFITKWEYNSELYDEVIELPETSEILSPFTSLLALDLFALYLAEDLWRDVDKPQNLAKSVTVE